MTGELIQEAAPTARELVAAEVRAAVARQKETSMSLARQLGRSQRYWYDRLNAAVAFSTDDLGTIADYLGVSMASLMPSGGDSPRPGGGAGRRNIYLLPHLDSNQEPIG